MSKTTELWKDVRDESRSKDLHEAGMENRTVSERPIRRWQLLVRLFRNGEM